MNETSPVAPSRIRVGYLLPAPVGGGAAVTRFARDAEAAGADSLWVSDHVLMPDAIDSHYPFAADGRATWSTDVDWFDALVVLGWAAAVTDRVELGTAVLVAPIRHPVILAKQWATLDAMAGGRTVLGIGVGWLEEEFDALGATFRRRGALTDEWVEVVRACWTGVAGPRDGTWPLPGRYVTKPTPAREVPMLVGGTSDRALRRAAQLGGWMGHESLDAPDLDGVEAAAQSVRSLSPDARIVLRLVRSADIHVDRPAILAELTARGIDEVVLDPPRSAPVAEALGALRSFVPPRESPGGSP